MELKGFVPDHTGSGRARCKLRSLASEPGFCSILGNVSSTDKEGQLMDSGWASSRQGRTASLLTHSGLSSPAIPPLSQMYSALEPGPSWGTWHVAWGGGH